MPVVLEVVPGNTCGPGSSSFLGSVGLAADAGPFGPKEGRFPGLEVTSGSLNPPAGGGFADSAAFAMKKVVRIAVSVAFLTCMMLGGVFVKVA